MFESGRPGLGGLRGDLRKVQGYRRGLEAPNPRRGGWTLQMDPDLRRNGFLDRRSGGASSHPAGMALHDPRGSHHRKCDLAATMQILLGHSAERAAFVLIALPLVAMAPVVIWAP